jgi:hypothetical protein
MNQMTEQFFFLLSAAQIGFYHEFVKDNDPDEVGREMTNTAIAHLEDVLKNNNPNDHLDALEAPAGLDASISGLIIEAYRVHISWAGVFLNHRDELGSMLEEWQMWKDVKIEKGVPSPPFLRLVE